MKAAHYHLLDEVSMGQLAQQWAICLSAPLMITFKGPIGAGKTTFIRAMLRALGILGPIKSPTFSLVESYSTKSLLIHHFDLYRIHDEHELDYVGFRDFFTDDAICCIEWPERSTFCSEKADIECVITMHDAGRQVDFNALTAIGEKVLLCLTTQ